MKKVDCTLLAPGDDEIVWPCYESGVPGLIVHRAITYKGRNLESRTYGILPGAWSVSHMLSGQRVVATKFRTRKAAVLFAESIAGMADWTKTVEKLVLVPNLYTRLKRLVREFAERKHTI